MSNKVVDSKAYEIISKHYGDSVATRSQVPLMNHIDEGLQILACLGATELAKDAFCIHPIVQIAILDNNQVPDDVLELESFPLAYEYSMKANSYLCCKETDYVTSVEDIYNIVGDMTHDCRLMLIADKIQNRKDFTRFHKGTHERSDQLTAYFDLWLQYLFTQEYHYDYTVH